MTRRLLSVTMALGLLVTAVGFGGIFAVFTDRATTGGNSVISGTLPRAADIKIQTIALGATCDTTTIFEDNLISTLVNWTDAAPGGPTQPVGFCIKNVGTAPLTIDWKVIDLVDADVACTGDESTVDLTCGLVGGAPAAGELATVLYLSARKYDCSLLSGIGTIYESYLSQAAITSLPVLDTGGSLAPGAFVCLKITTSYPDYLNGTTVEEGQAAQSDQATWRFAFDATT